MIFIKLVKEVEVLIVVAQDKIDLVSMQIFRVVAIANFKVKLGQKSVWNGQIVNDILRIVANFLTVEGCQEDRLRINNNLLG